MTSGYKTDSSPWPDKNNPTMRVDGPGMDLNMVFVECPLCHLLSHIPDKELEGDRVKCRHCGWEGEWEE